MRKFILLVLLAAVAATASAQKYPERSQVRKGNRAFDKGEWERSIERYKRAAELSPGNYEAVYNTGNALYKAEKFDQAEKTLLAAAADTLRSAQERAEAFFNLGDAQFRQEKYREALESYKNSLRLNPSDREAKYNYVYTKRLLDQNQDQNQDQNKDKNQDQNQNQNQNQDQNQDQNKDQNQNQNQDQDQDQDQNDDRKQDQDRSEGGDAQTEPQPAGISPEEQERMLDAIQAQEDKTQEKLKEKAAVRVRGGKNW